MTEEDQMVPLWLAVIVLVLLLACVGVGGFILRDVLDNGNESKSALDLEIEDYEGALSTSPDDIKLHVELGFAYQRASRYDDAIAEYDAALDLDPRDTAALYNKGVILIELEEFQRAEEVLWDVLEIEPTHTLAASRLGKYYASLGEYHSVVVAVRPAAEEHTQMADLQYLMGLAYENTGHPDWAEMRYGMALECAPDMQEARDGLERLGVSE